MVVLAALALFVCFDIALFGWLTFRSLSERELERIILETRNEAEQVADQIADDAERWGEDLTMALATNAETRTYIDSVLAQREVVDVVRVLDQEQRVVYQSTRIERYGEEVAPTISDDELPEIVTETVGTQTTFDVVEMPVQELPVVEVPVGNVGTFSIGLRRESIEQRLESLRADLFRQASSIGALTLLLFGAAAALIISLLRRSQKFQEQAKEAEQLAYVGTLASGLAHEIRSPLNSLNLNMQMLEEEMEAGEQGRHRLLQITRSEISRLERLVTDFLSYARPRSADLEVVEAGELLRHAAEIVEGTAASQGSRLVVDDRGREASVSVDPGQVNQMLLNLIDNALHAVSGREGSEVRLVVEPPEDGHVRLGVEDNGSGMSAEQIARAADVFYSERRGGTGLGLAIVDRIARNHGGALQIESRPGRTSAMVRLPLAAAN